MADKKTALKKLAGAGKSKHDKIKSAEAVGRVAKNASNTARYLKTPELHQKAVEAHEKASRAYARQGMHEESAAHARASYAHREAAGGGEWDESKHSRDESGMFS